MSRVIGTLVVSLVLLFTIGLKADDKPTTKNKTLPQGWSKLGLSDDQKKQVYKVRGEIRDKIEDLKQQITALEKEEKTLTSKVLTPAQRSRLKELLLSKQILDEEPIQGKQESPKQETPPAEKEKPGKGKQEAPKEKQEAPKEGQEKPGKQDQSKPGKQDQEKPGKGNQDAPKQGQEKPGKEKQETPKEKQEAPKEKQENPKEKDKK